MPALWRGTVVSEFDYLLDARDAIFTANAAQTVENREGGRRSMRSSILTLLVAALGLALNATPAHGESVHIVGGKLVPDSGPPSSFTPKSVHINVWNLPAGWSVGAGRCHTVKHETSPGVKFGFGDGRTDGAGLQAGGFSLDGGRSTSPYRGYTFITLCRDKSGRATSFTVQLGYCKFSTNLIEGYLVSAQNTSPVSGSSGVGYGSFSFEHPVSTTASSKAVNRLHLSR